MGREARAIYEHLHTYPKPIKMENTKLKKVQKPLLLIVSIGLIPIALSYGLMPDKSLGFLFEIEVANINLENILCTVNNYCHSTMYDYFAIVI